MIGPPRLARKWRATRNHRDVVRACRPPQIPAPSDIRFPLCPLGQETETDPAGIRGNQVGWALDHHRRRDPLASGPLATPRPNSQTRRPRRRPARPPLCTMASNYQPPHPRPGPDQRQPSNPATGTRARRSSRTTRRPDPAGRQSRSTALFQLTTELPAALLARMLGIHITVAVAWQRASNGDWTSYAAQVSRQPKR